MTELYKIVRVKVLMQCLSVHRKRRCLAADLDEASGSLDVKVALLCIVHKIPEIRLWGKMTDESML